MHRDIADKAFMNELEGGIPVGAFYNFGAFRSRGKSRLAELSRQFAYGSMLVNLETDYDSWSDYYFADMQLFNQCQLWLDKREVLPRTNVVPRSSHLTYCIKQAYRNS